MISHLVNWLKRHFIPHQENEHRPHMLHAVNVRQIIGIVLFFELVLFVIPTFNFVSLVRHSNLGAVLPAVLATQTNEERQDNNLNQLVINDELNTAAQLKAEDMAGKGYFAHTSPEGKSPWYWLDQVGYKYDYAGENLAVNFTDSKDVTDAWMNSPTHRANIVKANYREVGTGVAIGTYKGQRSIFVVQLYANPVAKPSPAASPTRFAIKAPSESVVPAVTPAPTPTSVAQANQTSDVLGEETPASAQEALNAYKAENKPTSLRVPTRAPTFLEKTLAAPRHTTNAVLYTVIGIVMLALTLNIVIKFKHHHPDLVTNGLFAIVFIFGIFVVNAYISWNQNSSTSFVAFSGGAIIQEK